MCIWSLLVLLYGMGYSEDNPSVEAPLTEIIIKVKEDVIIMPEGSYKSSISDIEINSKELSSLNMKYNLVTIEKMYARKRSEKEAAREYPEREARAPADAEEPDLDNTYLLKFPEHIEPREIVSEYERIDDVIYAEENKTLSIF
ncbi:hypothetical protein OAA99_01765 [Omnitrophica bacterium]|nr:hypothetical protein [Candidatus Omnitrophota bacterium]